MNARQRVARLRELQELRERQRSQRPETLREFQEREAAAAQEEAATAQAERERPIREAEAALNQTYRKLRANALEQINKGRPDPGFKIPRSVAGKQMPASEVEQFNASEIRKFAQNNPDFYTSQANIQLLCDYLTAQRVLIADNATYKAAAKRLQFLGLLEERPEPEPTPEPITVAEVPSQERIIDDGSMEGFDPETGHPRRYTAFEIERMSAETFKRTFRIKPVDLVLARRF
jgi:hypothetical protein